MLAASFMYKALISDFDNTIAGYDAQVPGDVKNVINRLIQQGYLFAIATGRAYQGKIQEICQELQLKTPQIVFGGAEIVDPSSGKKIWKEHMDPHEIERLIAYFLKENIYFLLEKDGFIYIPSAYPGTVKPHLPAKRIQELDGYNNIPKIRIPSQITKMTKKKVTALIKNMEKSYKDMNFIGTMYAGYFGCDITSLRATKHLAVLEYMKIMKLKKAEVVGIGDGYNDFPLLTACGMKVAMGDAPQELKEIADLVVGTQIENGFLVAARKIFLDGTKT